MLPAARNRGLRNRNPHPCGYYSDLLRYCEPDAEARGLLRIAITDLSFSARAYDRILKVRRTIADLPGAQIPFLPTPQHGHFSAMPFEQHPVQVSVRHRDIAAEGGAFQVVRRGLVGPGSCFGSVVPPDQAEMGLAFHGLADFRCALDREGSIRW